MGKTPTKRVGDVASNASSEDDFVDHPTEKKGGRKSYNCGAPLNPGVWGVTHFFKPRSNRRQAKNTNAEASTSQSKKPGPSKSTKRKEMVVEMVEEIIETKKKSLTHRCSLSPIYSWMSSNRGKIMDAHAKSLDATPFGPWFRLIFDGKLLLENTMKRNQAVTSILQAYNREESYFTIGKEHLKVKSEDIALIFGLPRKGKGVYPLQSHKKADKGCEFISRYFDGKTKDSLRKKDIEEAMVLSLTEYKDDVNDFAKLWILHCFTTFFFPNGSETLAWSFYYHMQEIEHLWEVSWPATILQHLNIQIVGMKNPSSCSGCLHILLYWLCEHTNLIEQENEYDRTLPRIVKWSIPKLCKVLAQTNLKQNLVCDVTLHIEASSNAEMELLTAEPERRTPQKSKPTVGQHEDDQSLNDTVEMLTSKIRKLEYVIESKDVEIENLKSVIIRLQTENKLVMNMLIERELHKKKDASEEIIEPVEEDYFTQISTIGKEAEPAKEGNFNKKTNMKTKPDSEITPETDIKLLSSTIEERNETGQEEEAAKEGTSKKKNKKTKLDSEIIPAPEMEYQLLSILERKKMGEPVEATKKGSSKKRNNKKKKTTTEITSEPEMENNVKGKEVSESTQHHNEKMETSEVAVNLKRKFASDQMVDTKNKRISVTTMKTKDCIDVETVAMAESENSGRLKGLGKSSFLKELSHECIVFFSMEYPSTIAWSSKCGVRAITGKMLENVIYKSLLHGTVIDFFQCYLQRNKTDENIRKSVFLPTFGWEQNFVRDGKHYKIDEILERYQFNPSEVKWLFAPIYSLNHWTLLVLDVSAPQWIHYNSYLSRRRTNLSCNPTAADARKIKKYLEEAIDKIRGQQSLPKLKSIGKNHIEYCTTCAQQPHASVDCGIFVCKYMKDLVYKNDVSSSYTAKEIDETRIEIANAVFSDPDGQSWQLKEFDLDTPLKDREIGKEPSFSLGLSQV